MSNKKDKTKKQSGHEQVISFLDKLDHPMKSEIELVRKIILESNKHLSEHIKWNAPSFFTNDDRITFNLHGKDGFRLIFHCGAKATKYAKGKPLYHDSTNLLNWVSGDRAIVNFRTMDEILENKELLKQLVNEWIEVTKDI